MAKRWRGTGNDYTETTREKEIKETEMWEREARKTERRGES